MSKNNRDPFASGSRDIFNVSDQAMSEDVTDAARILRSFVSNVEPMSDGSQERLFGVQETPFQQQDPFLGAPLNPSGEGVADEAMVQLMQSASHISDSLTDAMEFVPRVVEGASGVFSLHPKEDQPQSMRHPPIRLRYKGKASKKQLERLRQRVQMHTQHI